MFVAILKKHVYMQAQAPATITSAIDRSGGHVPVSPGRTPLSPLAAVSTHAFMQLTGMQQKIDACKLSDNAVRAIMSMQPLARSSDLPNHGEYVVRGILDP